MHRGTQVIGRGALFIAATAGLALSAASSASAARASDWPAYLDGPRHTSYNAAATAITPANSVGLVSRWRFLGIRPTRPGQPGRGFLASPTVVGGNVYIGADTGWFYKLNATTGHVLAKRFVGFQRATTCRPGRGFVDTATVEPDQSGKLTVYVGGADGYLYVTTGNAGKGAVAPGHSDSIIKLSPNTLRLIRSFKVPSAQLVGDGDFGASPTVFGPDVGACNKNGVFYALRRSTMKVAWSRRIGAPAPHHGVSNCSASAIYDGRTLFVAGPRHVINGKAYPGSVQALNPNTGALLWRTGLANGVIGSPSLDGGGVLAVGTYGFTKTPNEVYLLDASTGSILRRLVRGSADFAQSVFAEGRLFTANGNGLVSWILR